MKCFRLWLPNGKWKVVQYSVWAESAKWFKYVWKKSAIRGGRGVMKNFHIYFGTLPLPWEVNIDDWDEYREQTKHCRKAEVMWTGKVEVKYGVNCSKMSAKTFPSWPRLHLSQMNGTNVVGIHGQFHIEAGTSIQSKGHLYKIRKLFIGSSLQVDGSYRCPNCNFPLCSPDCAQGIHALVSAVNATNPITTV